VRLTLELLGRRYALGRSTEPTTTYEPQPDGSTCGNLERGAVDIEHVRMPVGTYMPESRIGFGRNE
jgi:hypothetical protein